MFKCKNCGKDVDTEGYIGTKHRNHCPYCLHSKHLDINPGDRLSSCHGIMKPIAIDNAKGGKYKIVYVCQNCGER